MLEFLPVLAVLVAIPGPSNLVVLRSLAGGRTAALAAALGASTGLLIWTAATAGGVGTVLAHVPGLQIAGALVVVVVGLWSLRPRARRRGGVGFRGGLVVCLGNPRALMTAVGVLPQYAEGPTAVLALGAVWALAAVLGNLVWVAGLQRVADSPWVQRLGAVAVVGVGLVGLAQAV